MEWIQLPFEWAWLQSCWTKYSSRPDLRVSNLAEVRWIRNARVFADSGYPQAGILLVSVVWMLVRVVRRRFKSVQRCEDKASGISLPFELCSQIARATAFAFLLAAAINGHTPWSNFILVSYAFVMGLLRLLNDLEWRHIALHQVNVGYAAALSLLTISTVLPCAEAVDECQVSQLLTCCLVSLGVVVFIAVLTPREWIPPTLLYDVPDHSLDTRPAPEETCSYLNRYLTYDWLTPLVWKGTRGEVAMDDLPNLAWYDEPLMMLQRIKAARAKSKSTFWTIMRLMHKELSLMAIWIGISYILEVVPSFALYFLLDYLAHPSEALLRPWVWLMLMFVGPIARSVTFQQYIFTSTRLVVRLKSAFIQELYHRAMDSMELEDDPFIKDANKGKAGQKGKQTSTSAGRLANLMAADVDAINGSRDIIMICIGVPSGTVVALIGLYKILGWPAMVGAAILFLSSPLTIIIAQAMGRAQRAVRKAQDSRISMVTEYLSSIRAIKYFAWEDAVTEKIDDARRSEQKGLWRTVILSTVLGQIIQLVPYVALIAMFSLYVAVLKQPLTAANAFTTVFLVKTVRKNLAQMGYLSRRFTEAQVAIGRLDRYFASTVPVEKFPDGPPRIVDGSFRKHARATFQLKNVSIDFVEGGLNVVTGQSGSGKTTLLLAMLGETIREGGSVTRPNDVAFASQSAWLQNDTVKANIVFNSEYEKARYDRVVEACCLPYDFGELQSGDETMVGENGQSLSGGQKARVALARALYSKAPLLLLDDIFSALDAKTAASLWELCFCSDMLQGRTTILVAQLPWVATQADLAITLENGMVKSTEQNIGVVRKPVVTSKIAASETEVEAESSSDALNETTKVAEAAPARDLIDLEMAASGKSARLKFLAYMNYFGGPSWVLFCLVILVIGDGMFLLGSLWLSIWVGAYEKEEAVSLAFYLGIYALLAFGESVISAVINLIYQSGGWRAARLIHREFVQAILGVSLSWFKAIPVGRVINRFSRDMASVDNSLAQMLQYFLEMIVMLLYRIGAIGSIMPIFMLPASITCFLGVVVGEMYTRTAVTVKKLVSSSNSPVFTQFSDTLAGLAVIRARADMPDVFGKMLADKLRKWSRAAEANYNCNRWVAVRVDAITAVVSLCAGIIAVSKAGSISAGLVGFSLTNATGLSQTILALVRIMNELEVEMQSFNRIREYITLEPEDKDDKPYPVEGAFTDNSAHVIPKAWPRSGDVEFRNVTIRYELDGPNILTDINLKFKTGERVAIIGRTGSGKSTLVLSLLRFTHIVSGTILYDGVDITNLPRRKLREALTIIPQEPVLFSGTVESNLDPSGKVPKEILESAIDECRSIASFQYLTEGNGAANEADAHASADTDGHPEEGHEDLAHAAQGIALTTTVQSKGDNFSHGQRQVLSLCRALIRKSKLMLLDEATASMDYETDRGIQVVLREELNAHGRDRTLVTIAHRLRTIIDYDTVVVMGGGKVLEVGSPYDLYHQKGQFYDMVYHSGELEDLQKILEE